MALTLVAALPDAPWHENHRVLRWGQREVGDQQAWVRFLVKPQSGWKFPWGELLANASSGKRTRIS